MSLSRISRFLANADFGGEGKPRKVVPCSKSSAKEARGGMQVTYMHSKMKGACAMSAGLVISLQRRSLNEDALTKMTAW